MTKLTLLLVGGGAIVETVYLPLLQGHPDIEVMGLVEPNNVQKGRIIEKFPSTKVFTSLDELAILPEAALVAVPNYLHKAVSVNLLERGMHIMVEKPMAITSQECGEMIQVAKACNKRLMTAMVRRCYSNIQHIKKIIRQQPLGKLEQIEVEEGYVFNWPVTSDSLINKTKSGGGVLIDIGVHVIDTLFYLLGEPKLIEYADDGGEFVEAEAFFTLEWSDNVHATVRLSRLRNLSNTIRLLFEGGEIEIDIKDKASSRIIFPGIEKWDSAWNLPPDHRGKLEPFRDQLSDFAKLIRKDIQPKSSLEESMAVIKLIEKCFQNKKNLSSNYIHF